MIQYDEGSQASDRASNAVRNIELRERTDEIENLCLELSEANPDFGILYDITVRQGFGQGGGTPFDSHVRENLDSMLRNTYSFEQVRTEHFSLEQLITSLWAARLRRRTSGSTQAQIYTMFPDSSILEGQINLRKVIKAVYDHYREASYSGDSSFTLPTGWMEAYNSQQAAATTQSVVRITDGTVMQST